MRRALHALSPFLCAKTTSSRPAGAADSSIRVPAVVHTHPAMPGAGRPAVCPQREKQSQHSCYVIRLCDTSLCAYGRAPVNGQPVLHLESTLFRFFQHFVSILRSQLHYFLDECCFLRCIDLGRRSSTRRNQYSNLFEELLLACRRADAKHPHRLRRGVMELMRSVRWNVHCFSSANNPLLSSESSLQLTVEKNKGLLEIMTMRGRAASGRNVHIEQRELTCSIRSGQQDRVGVAHNSEMLGTAVIRVCNHQIPSWVVRRNRYRVWNRRHFLLLAEIEERSRCPI